MNAAEEIYQRNLDQHLVAEDELPLASEMKPQQLSVNRLASPNQSTNNRGDSQDCEFNPTINQKSQKIKRGYEDLIAWKQNVNAKNQLLQQYQNDEQLREQIEQFVYTNPTSNQLLGNKRDAQKVEDILIQKGEETKLKLQKKQDEIYGSMGRPEVNKYSSQYTDMNVYCRLYDKAVIARQQKQEIEKQNTLKKNSSQSMKHLNVQSPNSKMQRQPAGGVPAPVEGWNWSKVKKNTEEQDRVMQLLQQNFSSAKSHLQNQKEMLELTLEQERVRAERIEEEQRRIREEQERLAQLEEIARLQQQQQQQQQQILELGVSANKSPEDADHHLVSNLIEANQSEVKNSISKGQIDPRVLFLAPEERPHTSDSGTRKGINVMDPKVVFQTSKNHILKEQKQRKELSQKFSQISQSQQQKKQVENESNRANSSSIRQQQLSSQSPSEQQQQQSNQKLSHQQKGSSSNAVEELIEKKASPQFKQFFKPVAWNASSAKTLLESKNLSVERSSSQVEEVDEENRRFQENENRLMQSYVQSQSHTNSMYQRVAEKQMDETHTQLSPKTVYFDFNKSGQNPSQLFLSNKSNNNNINSSNVHRSQQISESLALSTFGRQKNTTDMKNLKSAMSQKEIDEMVRKQIMWMETKDRKVEQQREAKKEKEMETCTFKPEMSSSKKMSLQYQQTQQQQQQYFSNGSSLNHPNAQLTLSQSSQKKLLSPSKQGKPDSYVDVHKIRLSQQLNSQQQTAAIQEINPDQQIGEPLMFRGEQGQDQHHIQHENYENNGTQSNPIEQIQTEFQF